MTKWLTVSLATLALVACSCAPTQSAPPAAKPAVKPVAATASTTKPPAAVQVPATTNKPAVSPPVAKPAAQTPAATNKPAAKSESKPATPAQTATNKVVMANPWESPVPGNSSGIRIRGKIADIKVDGANKLISLTPVNSDVTLILTVPTDVSIIGGKLEDLKVGDRLRVDYTETNGKKVAIQMRPNG